MAAATAVAGLGLVCGSAAAATVEDLEARLKAQEARIRALEATIVELTGRPSPVAPEPSPPPLTATTAPPAAPADAGFPTATIRGRLQFDALVSNRGDGPGPTGSEIRRFYLGAAGRIAPRVRYSADVDFAGDRAIAQDVFVAYEPAERVELMGGYFKPPITQDEMTSDVHTLFLERSAYSGVFAPGRRMGLGFGATVGGVGLRGGVFGEREGASPFAEDEGWLAAARASADVLPGPDVLHLAASGYHAEPGGPVRHRQKPETNLAAILLDTGALAPRDGDFLGGEAGFQRGAVLFQAEGGALRWRAPGANPRFAGWSVQASWRLTGEARPYDPQAGVFSRVRPARGIDEGGPGAVELGLRLTEVDLDDVGVTGGRLTSYGAVVNWYPVTRLRMGGNLIRAVLDRPAGSDLEQTLLTVRTAIDW